MARPLHVRGSVLARYPVPLIGAAVISTAVFHLYLVVKYDIITIPLRDGGTALTLARTQLYKDNSEAIDAMGVAAKV